VQIIFTRQSALGWTSVTHIVWLIRPERRNGACSVLWQLLALVCAIHSAAITLMKLLNYACCSLNMLKNISLLPAITSVNLWLRWILFTYTPYICVLAVVDLDVSGDLITIDHGKKPVFNGCQLQWGILLKWKNKQRRHMRVGCFWSELMACCSQTRRSSDRLPCLHGQQCDRLGIPFFTRIAKAAGWRIITPLCRYFELFTVRAWHDCQQRWILLRLRGIAQFCPHLDLSRFPHYPQTHMQHSCFPCGKG